MKGPRGISLVELMVAVTVSTILALVLYQMAGTHSRIYSIQDDVTETQQNLRIAVERISRDLKMAGLGKPSWSEINGYDLTWWYNSANGYRASHVTESGTGHVIDIVGCIDGSEQTLGANAATGSTTLTLQKGDGSLFNATSKSDISIGNIENAKVRSVSGDLLTIDTDPAAPGNQGLHFDHSDGTTVCNVRWMTYSRDEHNNFTVDEHRGAGNQPVAQNITGLSFSVTGNLVSFTFTGRSQKPDRTTGQYTVFQVAGKVLMRN